jgi:ABC-type transport system involved in cytochrome c biogenesis permease subunit
MNSLLRILALCLALPALAAEPVEPTLETLRDKELVAAWSTLPVQEEGRLKPLDTVARYRLLRFHGTRTLRFENAETKAKDKLSPMEWLLVSWFKPELAKTLPLFRVDNPDAVIEIGAQSLDKMDGVRGKYAFNDILPHRQKLMEKMQEYRQTDAKARTAVQTMILNLGVNFLDYEMMLTHWDFVRKPFGEEVKSIPADLSAKLPQPLRTSTALKPLMEYITANPGAGAPMQNPWLMSFMRGALGAMMSGNQEQSLRIFPQGDGANEQWTGPGWIIMDAVQGTAPTERQLQWLKQYEDVALAAGKAEDLKAKTKALVAEVRAADTAGAARYVEMEAGYHRADYFYYALQCFVLGLILLGIHTAVKSASVSRWMLRSIWLILGAGTVLSVIGIIIRCIIMQRPPITTLYETIIFIASSGALLGLVAEAMTRKRWGLLLCAVCGVAGFYLSIRFEEMDKQDTIQQLQAVLMTNFWLATHVPCINLGYAACMVANVLGMIYLLGRALGLVTKESGRDLTRMSYGFICAGLFLALIGTILGGIWANYSWGRFWGWDPKENGALMICLMCLITLHARLGGYVKEVGIHVCSLILGSITMFSWFGVNQLGVGLHAYGFTDGVWGNLSKYWLLQVAMLPLAWWVGRANRWKQTVA